MKEMRFFYVPDAVHQTELPPDEAMHAMRVLRLKGGDELFLMDGEGNYYRAEVTIAATHHCYYQITECLPQEPQWKGHLHLAIAPTKTMDRIEWMTEKATEIGIDEISYINCQFSERRLMKTTRLEKIAISAIKQSHKAWKPVLHEMEPLKKFLEQPRQGKKYIAHCYEEIPRTYLFDELKQNADDEEVTVLIGPEGDFSLEEVRICMEKGYQSVHLGKSRLRTETAGLAAVMMMQLAKS
ncbi:MAG: 16S rRNA (uracil(1498)-N(3))-methyltransferase [Prevotella sp.]|jgi:16S rRNA (uracil1498-N3)-methyltransferase|nr:16S rRNA (uracil(1498)-N(3))-methyltransferase [Prevotella sp.]